MVENTSMSEERKKTVDFFISHASEDKDEFVREFANRLLKFGYLTFYDEYSIKLGDSIVEKINQGLIESKVFLLIISPEFLRKDWTNKELNSIFSISTTTGKRIIPIFHNIDHSDFAKKYPLLHDIKGTNTNKGIDFLCQEIIDHSGISNHTGFIVTKFDESIDIEKDGLILIIGAALPHLYNPQMEKCLYQLGVRGRRHSKLSILIHENNSIAVTLTTSNNIEISLNARLSKTGPPNSTFFLSYKLDIKNKIIELMINEEIVSSFSFVDIDLSDFKNKDLMEIVGGTMDYTNPCPFLIQMQGLAKCEVDIIKVREAFLTYLNGLNKIK